MNNYVPFLKIKPNEIGALSELALEIKPSVTPFFDFPRKKDMTPESFQTMVVKGGRSMGRHLKDFDTFFIDNFDIDDDIKVSGLDNYQFIIDACSDLNFIPVVGLDRTPQRNECVFTSRASGKIQSNLIALRLQSEDFEDFDLVQDAIGELIIRAEGLFEGWILVLDNRLCLTTNVTQRSDQIIQFLNDINAVFEFDRIIVTGSSIPASIGEIAETESESVQLRNELLIFRVVAAGVEPGLVTLGDYTIISPLYSDLTIPPEAMRNVTAAKITYSHADTHIILRGGALKTHARGNLQYNDLALDLIGKAIYRGHPYSTGDFFLHEKANFIGKGVTQSSILKPTINAHMTYMSRDFTV